MNPQEFRERWLKGEDEELFPISSSKLSTLGLQQQTIAFLKNGLPSSTAPFLSFNIDDNSEYNRIGTLSELYNIDATFDNYIVIGSDGSGNPIAINKYKNDLVEWFDHEDNFRSTYVNKSLAPFLTFIILYRDFVIDTQKTNGEYAFLDANFTDEDFVTMKQKMLMVDAMAINQPGFWKEELSLLLANREHYLKNSNRQNL